VKEANGPTDPVVPSLLILLLLTLATQLGSLAYTTERDFSAVVLPSTIVLLLVTLPLAALGLRLGAPIGLGAPDIGALFAREPGAARRVFRNAAVAGVLGLGLGLLLWLLRLLTLPYLPPELPELGHRGPLGGLLVSLGAAVGEEVWLRLGAMTLLAWLLVRVTGGAGLKPGQAWTAIGLSAVLFGIIHLPQLSAAGAATATGIVATLAGNAMVGALFGWCYWRRGLVAAMSAHFFVDIALHVFPALVD